MQSSPAGKRKKVTGAAIAKAWNARVDGELAAAADDDGRAAVKAKYGHIDAIYAKQHEDRLQRRAEQSELYASKADQIIELCRAKKALRAAVPSIAQADNQPGAAALAAPQTMTTT